MSDYEKKGYLSTDYRIFRLKDSTLKPIPFHYHDFHKIILFLDGNVDYVIEGKTYHLTARDVVFVSAGEIHRPIFLSGSADYERIVIYVSPSFLERWQQQDPQHNDLSQCFSQARATASVMHQAPGTSHDLLFHMDKLEKTAHGEGFANGLFTEILFIEFMILINRLLEGHELAGLENASYDQKIQDVLAYINQHLAEDLSIDTLATHTYTSKFYLMRKFKANTGYALHQYIRSKRLLLARDMLRSDMPIAQIAGEVGFADYSTFSRAFREMFQCSPREYRNTH
ncbi:AraC family transcriptional regulator [Selenomonas sp. ND2010]|uniref:AraC family transcriptional regulator n=1 Tax=Selenomonas sp. ND2010 TaxID=1410618 RepID=UPI00051C8ADA|nr:AraC family transcriptional regulator [Selenomonas sp. ND2010]